MGRSVSWETHTHFMVGEESVFVDTEMGWEAGFGSGDPASSSFNFLNTSEK